MPDCIPKARQACEIVDHQVRSFGSHHEKQITAGERLEHVGEDGQINAVTRCRGALENRQFNIHNCRISTIRLWALGEEIAAVRGFYRSVFKRFESSEETLMPLAGQCPRVNPCTAKVDDTLLAILTHAFRAIGVSVFGPKRATCRADNEVLEFRSSIGGVLGMRRDQCFGRFCVEVAGVRQRLVFEGDDALGKFARCHVIICRSSE